MAGQRGYGPLNFSAFQGTHRATYFKAVRAGLDRDYRLMERMFSAALRETKRTD